MTNLGQLSWLLVALPAAGALKVPVSALPEVYGRQLYVVVVGAAPIRTYMSASPVPPEIVNTTLVLPAGTTIV